MPKNRAFKNNQCCDIAIIGGGIAGKTSALLLAQSGFKITIIDRENPEKFKDPNFDGRTTALSFGSKKILEKINVWSKLAKSACPILDIRVTDGNSPLPLHFDHSEVGAEPMGHIIDNYVLRRVLYDAVEAQKNIQLCAPVNIQNLTRDELGVTIALENGDEIRASLLIGADGRKSMVRDWAGIAVKRWDYSHTAIVASLTHDKPHDNVAFERFLATGPLALLPMYDFKGKPASSLVWSESPETAKGLLEVEDDIFCALLKDRFGDWLGDFELIGKRYAFPLDFTHADYYVAERVALIGDAAHGIHPIAGQGLNLGLRDCDQLALHLAKGRDLGLDPGNYLWLKKYDKARRADVTSMCAVTDGLNRLFQVESAPISSLRKLGIGLVNKVLPLRHSFIRRAMGDFT
jgi:2-octaprenyl-6-methoxyphenol hydroxylase